MNKLNPIKYIENMLSHHPKSISLWITEGIVINGERYIIKEFRLRYGSLYAVIAENKYTPKYFEVKLTPDGETLENIQKAIEENKIAIEKEVTDRKNEIARVDTAIKANTTKIEQEIADRQNEITRVDNAINANTAKIDKEIADRESEIERVDQAIEATTEKINQEITDRQNEITRVDNAINANTAKIDKEIQYRKNEITRVDGAINANTEKINQEITDRTNEINRVDGKLTDLEDKLAPSDGKIAELDEATKENKAKIDQEIIDRKREIDRVDEATKANKATIDQEIANRRDEINRVNEAISANTAKINKEITDRQNEISRVDDTVSEIHNNVLADHAELVKARGSYPDLGGRLDNVDNKHLETITQLQQTVDYINNGTRKFKPKICNNLWFVNRNETTMRNMIQSQLDMGIEGFILCFHLDVNATNDGFTVQENITDMLRVVTEFYNKGVYFSALKFHCTDSILATSTTLQNAYKTLVLDYINMFNGLGIKHCIIFNERNDMFRTENISYIQGLLNDIKSLGLKVSINANSTGTMIANYRDFSDVTSIYDFISVNMYPQIGANGRGTTLTDCLNAWEEHSKFNNILSSNKPFLLTETGMRPYWVYFSSPAGYEYDDPDDYSIDAQILYFKGLFESGMNDLADEVWLWFFPEFYDEKIASLIRYYTGKGDLAIE